MKNKTGELTEKVKRIGVCESKTMPQLRTVFHEVTIKLSPKYRVWPCPGDDRSILIDPSEYMDRYNTIFPAARPQ